MDLLQKPTLLLAGGVFIAGEDGLDVGWPGNQRHGVLPREGRLAQRGEEGISRCHQLVTPTQMNIVEMSLENILCDHLVPAGIQ